MRLTNLSFDIYRTNITKYYLFKINRFWGVSRKAHTILCPVLLSVHVVKLGKFFSSCQSKFITEEV